MPEYDRLIESSDWIDLDFVERERTPEPFDITFPAAIMFLALVDLYLLRLAE